MSAERRVTATRATSKLCLSCYDGMVAVDSFGGAALSDDHPIGLTYDSATATLNGSLFDPATQTVTIGSSRTKTDTITNPLLYPRRLECSSCHDLHNTSAGGGNGTGMVKISTAGSAICLACHAS